MRYERLKWICRAIEYDMLTEKEMTFLSKTVEDFMTGKLMNKGTEDQLEVLFAEIQWREIEEKSSYEIWSKEQKIRESVPIKNAIPTAISEESASGALS